MSDLEEWRRFAEARSDLVAAGYGSLVEHAEREVLASNEVQALFERTVCAVLGVPDHLTLICGMAVGYRDPSAPINIATTERDDPVILFAGTAPDTERSA